MDSRKHLETAIRRVDFRQITKFYTIFTTSPKDFYSSTFSLPKFLALQLMMIYVLKKSLALFILQHSFSIIIFTSSFYNLDFRQDRKIKQINITNLAITLAFIDKTTLVPRGHGPLAHDFSFQCKQFFHIYIY